jgi:ABC-type lipoprotein export system ATPase subunit/ABC-type antimicrobial peptide transport system permease subunit
MAKLLRLSKIAKTYNISKVQKQEVLKDVTVDFDRGEFVALVGESGCGKSTLINILGGLDSEYTGSVVCQGQFLRDFSEKQMDDYRKKRVGMVFQNYNLINHMNLCENIEIAMHMSDIETKVSHARTLDLLNMVGLSEYADKYPNQLSGGQQQRVAIARALANNPSIILADEPTGALDKQSEEIILQILKKIVEAGKLVIVVTHSEVVASHCSRLVRIDDGEISSDEIKYEIKKSKKYDKVIMPKPIRTIDLAKLSFRNLKQKLSRNLIVSIGLSIGIAAMILILNLGSGLTNYVQEVYADNLQSTQMTLYYDSYSEISNDELDQILTIEGIDWVIESSVINTADYSYNEQTGDIKNLNVYYDYIYPNIIYGSISSDGGILINETMALAISTNGIISVVGTELTLEYDNDTFTYTITGIYEDNTATSDLANVYISENEMLELLDDSMTTTIVYLNLEDVSYLNSVKSDLEVLNFNIYQEDNSAGTILSYIDMGTKILTGVSAISMVVAAIMIFIVLYISIVERTKEIGILRAIGARKKDISTMFIFEAGIIGLAGGLFGVLFSVLITLTTNTLTNISLGATLISYNIVYFLLGLGLSVVVSIIAGIAPAVKAADLDPAVSLRFE